MNKSVEKLDLIDLQHTAEKVLYKIDARKIFARGSVPYKQQKSIYTMIPIWKRFEFVFAISRRLQKRLICYRI